MGQKSNPNILRLGKIKEWSSRYIEKKNTESSVVIFQNLEIRKFISQLFIKNELQIQECKIAHSKGSLYVYVVFCSFTKTELRTSTQHKKIELQNKKIFSIPFLNKIKKIKKATIKKQVYLAKMHKKSFNCSSKKRVLKNQYFLDSKTNRFSVIKQLKFYNDGEKYKTLKKQSLNSFIIKVLKGLQLFMGKKQNIFLNLKQINQEKVLFQRLSKENKQSMQKSFIRLRKFQQNEFFKKGLNTFCNFVLTNPNPKFLAEFVALYLKKLKRPNFFLRFLKAGLKLFTNEHFSKLRLIQIKIKGRFNGAPRSSYKFIRIGKNIPVLTLNSKIDYAESTAFTSDGTFGIKIWILKQ